MAQPTEEPEQGKGRGARVLSFLKEGLTLIALAVITLVVSSVRGGQPPESAKEPEKSSPEPVPEESPAGTLEESGTEEAPHPAGGSARRRFQGLALAGIALVLIGAMVYTFAAFPGTLIGVKQPVPFSHRVHAGVKGINCRFCHPFAERGKNAGLPAVEKCMFCHKHIIPLNPWLVKEREHYATRTPVIWGRVYYVPDFVKFRHQPHVKWAKVNCDRCHGPVETLDRLKTKHFTMDFCISCHRSHHATVDCYLSCHH